MRSANLHQALVVLAEGAGPLAAGRVRVIAADRARSHARRVERAARVQLQVRHWLGPARRRLQIGVWNNAQGQGNDEVAHPNCEQEMR